MSHFSSYPDSPIASL